MRKFSWVTTVLLFLVWLPTLGISEPLPPTDGEEEMAFSTEDVSDPLESINRVSYKFNDLLYTGFLNPTAQVYAAIVPEPVRVSVLNFFDNLATPKHFAGALLQGKVKQSGIELSRFTINTLLGGLGFFDVAERFFDLKSADEDIGQVFGHYGAGNSTYFVWPVLGPSNLRDSFGLVGDTLLNPLTYINDVWLQAGIRTHEKINTVSLHLGEYETFKKSAFDPYIAMRDAYLQSRTAKIEE